MMKPHQKKILIADDDPAILDVLTLYLEDMGYKVEATQDGETLHTFENGLPDILVLDIWMSGWHGRDICRYLKSQAETCKLPILLVSANRETESIARAAGADDFLAKPFDLEKLLEKIERYL
jgi:DNA-binding response OmpR family regulator